LEPFMPPNPKRPAPRDLKFDEGEILRADDPRPQRVAQYPSPGSRKVPRKAEDAIPTTVYNTEKADEEMQAQYGMEQPETKPAFLYVERGPGQGQLLEVKQGTVVIGRASVSDLRLQHPSISRRHAQVKRIGEQFFVKDLGSQNGTFVNKQRIATELEVRPGDTLALGNALVRLRGPLEKGERLPGQKDVAPRPPPREKRVSTAVVARPETSEGRALKVAIIAGVAGFVVAAGGAFILVKATLGSEPKPKREAGSTAKELTPAAAAERERSIQAAIAARMKEKKAAPVVVAAPAVEAIEAAPSVVVMNERRAPAPAPAAAPRSPSAVAKAALAAKSRPAQTQAVDDAFEEGSNSSEEASPKGASGGAAANKKIMGPYERGNAEGSLELATKAGNKDLAGKITKFLQAYDAAEEARLANNGSAAIKGYTQALQLDEQLSSGWGKYGAGIRHQLANLYVLLGMQYAANGAEDPAKKSFEAALKYDPANSQAKSSLAKMNCGGDGEEAAAPAPKKAPAKPAKSAKQSIDDAFGD
jgi:pSer/pThr/pTyr-binding forkhead associated (FHA) protein